jgi:SAM-dependent methyltransferase
MTIQNLRMAFLLSWTLLGPGIAATAQEAPAPTEAGEEAFLGVELRSPGQGGVIIGRTFRGTAAAKHGLQAGDVILKIDDTPTAAFGELQGAIRAHRPGDRIRVELLRDGKRITKKIRLGPRPDDLTLRRDRADHVIEVLQIRPGQTVADIGCGSGWLAQAIAQQLGDGGKVYAVEIDEERISQLKARTIPGVVPVLSTPDDVTLPEDSLDIAVLHDVASHINRADRPAFYRSVSLALKPGGRLVIFGPHGGAEKIISGLLEYGFVPVDEEALQDLSQEERDRRLDDGIVFRERLRD